MQNKNPNMLDCIPEAWLTKIYKKKTKYKFAYDAIKTKFTHRR